MFSFHLFTNLLVDENKLGPVLGLQEYEVGFIMGFKEMGPLGPQNSQTFANLTTQH